MKKKTAVIAAISVFLVLVILSSVLIKVNRDKRHAEVLEAAMDAVIISSDKTVFPDFIYNSDSIHTDTVVGEKLVNIEPIEKPSLQELSQLSDSVVRGHVVSLSYTFIDGIAWTQADINISEVLKGGLVSGNFISVYFPGGFVSVEDYNEFSGENNPGGQNKYYSFKAGSAPIPGYNDELLLFISPSDGKYLLPEGSYSLSCAEHSVFNVQDGGKHLMQGKSSIDYETVKKLFN